MDSFGSCCFTRRLRFSWPPLLSLSWHGVWISAPASCQTGTQEIAPVNAKPSVLSAISFSGPIGEAVSACT